ncbi:glutamate racemase [Alginatibacterium sediminis]|uniref:Glutamate racemase n=1 Tax=Alginatibacterium sediminis TaxID=2164068 RepID=A0A420E5U2_9ALTE|nr:glutamate racemase [Alginatibacterium sediminis]RKF13108.1 glutamate racemase [Alginatibacterium sediminis]
MSANILVFDSGVGGLSVVDSLKRRCLDAKIDYLFDEAFFPYGELEQQQLIDRVCVLIKDAVIRLQTDLLVIACNSASTLALPKLRAILDIPIVGVVPAIKPAANLSVSKRILVLATPGTVKRQYTDQLIQDFAADCDVKLQGSTRLVELAEKQLRAGSIEQSDVDAIALQLCSDSWYPDVVVLACTHFPLLKTYLQASYGNTVTLLDSGDAIARRVQSLLALESDGTEGMVTGLGLAYTTAPKVDAVLASSLIQTGFKDLRLFE